MVSFEDELKAARVQGLAVAARLVGWTDAEDVVQAAALKAWKHYPDFRQDCTFKTWFTRIVLNEALMVYRSRRTTDVVTQAKPIEDVAKRLRDQRSSPEAQVLGQERRDRLAAAILQLKPKLRSTTLTYAVKKSRDGTLSQTEKARVFRAKKQLHKLLGGS